MLVKIFLCFPWQQDVSPVPLYSLGIKLELLVTSRVLFFLFPFYYQALFILSLPILAEPLPGFHPTVYVNSSPPGLTYSGIKFFPDFRTRASRLRWWQRTSPPVYSDTASWAESLSAAGLKSSFQNDCPTLPGSSPSPGTYKRDIARQNYKTSYFSKSLYSE